MKFLVTHTKEVTLEGTDKQGIPVEHQVVREFVQFANNIHEEDDDLAGGIMWGKGT